MATCYRRSCAILYPLSSILYPLSSILYPLSSILYPLSSILYRRSTFRSPCPLSPRAGSAYSKRALSGGPTVFEIRRLRGFTLPSFGQALVLTLATGVGWLLWTDQGTRHLILGLPVPIEAPMVELQTFEALVSAGRDAIPELRVMITDTDPRVRRHAALALGRIGATTGDSIE